MLNFSKRQQLVDQWQRDRYLNNICHECGEECGNQFEGRIYINIGMILKSFFLNPYSLQIEKLHKRHFWKKIPIFKFPSLMTSLMTNNFLCHVNSNLRWLGPVYVIWSKSRDVICVWYHVMNKICTKEPGNSVSVIFGKISRNFWELLKF